MSEQALNLRRSARIVGRHKIIVGIAVALGLLAGAGYATHHPPMLTSKTLVVLPPSASRYIGTQVVIAGSNPVLTGAMSRVDPPVPLSVLRGRVQVKSLTANVLSISAKGATAAQAEGTANAVASSYIAYLGTENILGGRAQARVLESATTPTGGSPTSTLLVAAGLGALLGALIGIIIALAIDRGDRRLRQRDEIADAIGIPVLASIPVRHLSDAAGWRKLLEDYKPGAVQAWSLRKALHHLGLPDVKEGGGSSLAVLSLASDRGALALGPQLAVFAASVGIRTALIIGPQQDANATATLRAACAAPPPAQSKRPSQLHVSVMDYASTDPLPDAALTIVVGVVDGQTPQVAETMHTATTVLGVSAGVGTAEQLARVAVSAAAERRHIAGILVADPDPTDHTTGRLPHLAPPTHRKAPTRLARTTTETRR